MAEQFQVSREWIQDQVVNNPDVRSALNATARRLAPIIQQEALKDGATRYAKSVRVQAGGIRPGTKSPTRLRRSYARVIIGDPDADELERGSLTMPKKGFLRRAVKRL